MQSDWIATNKGKVTFMGWVACWCHCMLYSLPFGVVYDAKVWAVVFLSHFIIDKFGLAKYWMSMMGICKSEKLYPIWLSTFLTIVIDNTMHLICNYEAITYLK